ncbi:MAG: hypothetical protein VCB82_06325 [Alphaproteobacteria bacterium]
MNRRYFISNAVTGAAIGGNAVYVTATNRRQPIEHETADDLGHAPAVIGQIHE